MLSIDYPNNGNFSSNVPYEFFLGRNTKEVLLDISEYMMFDIKKSLRKNAVVKAIAESVMETPEFWIHRLCAYEIDLLRRILELPSGEGLTIYHDYSNFDLMIAEMCLVVVYIDAESGEWTLYLSTESLRETLLKGLEYISQRGDEMNRRLSEFDIEAEGFLNTFGPMPYYDFISAMLHRTKGLVDDSNVMLTAPYMIAHSAFRSLTFNCGDSEVVYIAPRMVNEEGVSKLLDECMLRTFVEPDFEGVSDIQLRALGNRPYIRPTNAEGERLHRLCSEKMGLDAESADRLYTKLWTMVQVNKEPKDVMSWLSSKVRFTSFEQVQEFVSVYMDFSNSIPKWILKGHSSNDVFEKFEKPNMRPLPKEPFSFKSSDKVGRNDPCPCGSGKKYKHCCGK